MDRSSIFTDKEVRFLRELVKNDVRFMIVGLAAAALQGAPVVTQDVDLWFEDLADPRIKKALKKVGGALVPQIGLNPPMFAGESVRLFDVVLTMHGLGSFAEEWQHTLEILLAGVSVKVLKLARIIRSKETIKRPKDLMVLPVLKDVMKTIQTYEKGKKS
ncbi:MAG: hypothetical protein WBB73_04950 [Candidatus Aminicenantaceae bacterium]